MKTHRHGPPWRRRHRRPFHRGRHFRGHHGRRHSRLHRRIFIWFGISIALTLLLVNAIWSPLYRPDSVAHREQVFWMLGVACLCLWMASGAIAHRLIGPLSEVVRVARELGDGKLDSRVGSCRYRHDELGVLATAINDMAERIEKQMADQRELLAAVSHEIRTPLGHMRVLVELLRDKTSEPTRLEELEREIVDIDSLVGQLLASSRLAFDTMEERSLDAVEVTTRALERAGLSRELLDVEAESSRLRGDATLLARALGNLLDNALHHGKGVVKVVVSEGEPGPSEDPRSVPSREIRFEVWDRGPGFPDDEKERVFETFYRGERRAGQSSLGLGLALVQRIAEAHRGRAWADNIAAGGARVGFSVAVEPDHSQPA